MDIDLIKNLPVLESAPPKAIKAFEEYAILKKFSAGETLAMEGSDCAYFFILLSGNIRVYKISESGREITLYHVKKNESCVLTAFCATSSIDFPAFAVAEKDIEMVLIPSYVLREWVKEYEVWQAHMFNTLSIRLNEILYTLDTVLFQPLDMRIANYLKSITDKAHSNIINITHERLARELGSSRVAVSRILEAFKRDGFVDLSRGKITVIDFAGLSKKSKSAS